MLGLPEELRQVIAGSTSPEEVRLKLGITQDQIDQASTEFDRQRANDARKKRLVNVCGRDFENTDESQKKLWGTCWVSAASLLAFPDNSANIDEGRGCDIVFQHGGRTYLVEIKSSDGEPESFTLGSSEIRLAMEAVSSKTRRAREVYVVLRVRNALTSSPSFDVLPNPYDSRYADYFRVEEAGARIRYSL